MKTKSVMIGDNAWKWLLAGILGLAMIFGGYGLSHGMGMGGGMGMGMGSFGVGGGSMMGAGSAPDHRPDGSSGTFYRGSGQPAPGTVNVSREEAGTIVRKMIGDNPNLEVGKITEREDGFNVQVVTRKGGALADRLFVEKSTGRTHRIF